MKGILFSVLMLLPLSVVAQNTWEVPMTAEEKLELAKQAEAEAKKEMKEAKKAAKLAKKQGKKEEYEAYKKKEKAAKKAVPKDEKALARAQRKAEKNSIRYIGKGAVPEVDGRVVFTLDVDAPGKSAQEIYDITYAFLDDLAEDEQQIQSGIALFDKHEHIIAAKYSEWLEFTRTYLVLDRTEFNYTIIANCSDGHLNLTLERISYCYEEGRDSEMKISAELLITDKYAINEEKQKLLPLSAKFRRKTIDRKDEIFASLQEALK